jgi:RNA polymerase sigma-70 factor (ECF subfamily)
MLWEGQKLREIRNPASLKYWLSIVSGNAAMNFMQKRRRLTRLMPISLSDMDEDTLSGILEMAPNNTQRGHYGFALSDRLSGALETLSVRERLALKLSVLHGKRYEEIALMMSIPPATVSSHIRRAKEKLRKRLAGNGLP